MPYSKISELPDNIKSALPEKAQTVWMNAFNGAMKGGDSEDSARKIAWAAVKNGWTKDGDNWVKKQSETHTFDAEIFSTGTWNGDKYTLSDLNDMVHNFSLLADAIKPPVKLGHDSSKINDGAPALGWVKSLKIAGNKLIATLTDVPALVYQAIKKGLYKRISSEIYWDLKQSGKTYKRVLSAVALLGADIPAVKDLQDLQAFLSQKIRNESFEALKAYSFEADLEADVISIKNYSDNKGGDMSDEKLKALEEKFDALQKNFTELKGQKDDFEKKYKDLQQDVNAKEKKAKLDAIKAFCEAQVKAGKMTPAQRDIIIGDDALRVYTEGNALFIGFDQFQKFAELTGKQLQTDEKGKHVETEEITDAVMQFTEKVQSYVDEKNVTWEVAYNKCLTLYPKLAEAYTKD